MICGDEEGRVWGWGVMDVSTTNERNERANEKGLFAFVGRREMGEKEGVWCLAGEGRWVSFLVGRLWWCVRKSRVKANERTKRNETNLPLVSLPFFSLPVKTPPSHFPTRHQTLYQAEEDPRKSRHLGRNASFERGRNVDG